MKTWQPDVLAESVHVFISQVWEITPMFSFWAKLLMIC